MDTLPTVDIEKQLHLARQNLLDLTRGNRLINYRPSKVRSIQIVDDTPANLYEFLVIHGKSIEFRPGSPLLVETQNEQEDEEDLEEASLKSKEDTNSLNSETEYKRKQRHLRGWRHVNLESEELQKRLFQTTQQSKTFIEEQGYTVLFLALGFLEWRDNLEGETSLSPLVLVPVELDRHRVGRSYKLHWTGEDIFTNISLQAKLEEEGVSIPDFEMPEDGQGIFEYFDKIEKIASNEKNWQVTNNIYLDFFSFTKYVMYRDLDPEAWPKDSSPAQHPLIQVMFNPLSRSDSSQESFVAEKADETLLAKDIYHVMDADPSQVAVIEDVKKGQNMVVEGPPGTGKSQTITNIIATMMAEEKSVLFVSEKMAALEVVKKRLDQVGLGDFCLELHSRKSRKKDVIEELKNSVLAPPPPSMDWGEKFSQLDHLKSELNEYVRILRETFAEIGLSPFALNCMKESALQHFKKQNKDIPRVRFSKADKCTYEEWENARTILTSLSESLSLVIPLDNHPWKNSDPGVVLPSDEEEIYEWIEKCTQPLENIDSVLNELIHLAGVEKPDTLSDLKNVIEAAQVVAQSKAVSKEVLLSREWASNTGRPEWLIKQVEKAQEQRNLILEKFEDRVLGKDVTKVLDEYKRLAIKYSRFLSGKFRYLKWEVRFWYKDQRPRKAQEIISDLERINDYINLVEDIKKSEREAQNLFDFWWQNEHSKPEILREFKEWMEKFQHHLSRRAISLKAVELVSQGVISEPIEKAALNAQEIYDSLCQCLDFLEKRIGIEYKDIFQTEYADIPFVTLVERIKVWKDELPQLQRWSQFVSWRKDCLNSVAAPMINIIDRDLLKPEDVLPCFEGNFADELLRDAFAQYPHLANFVSELHESKIKRFISLDRESIALNRRRLAHRLYHLRPSIIGGASPNSAAGILLGEFNRKSGHMPIRKLMTLAGELIQKIKPCFMMSPLSIAKFFDPEIVRFDMIIFDEASQVRPEDALGALLRSDQVVVMGDTRQLPPTSFFDHIVQAPDLEQEIASISDMESILHQCKRSFPTRTLSRHYRSRHESLIAVSNNEFYNNELTVYPSPMHESPEYGLHLHHLPDTVYDRGNTTTNRQEAKAVAKAVTEHYRKTPYKSLGVGTFNIKQQQVILEEIELELLQNPDIEELIQDNRQESLFVKNLETIQGDERDVIFLSLGYGFDQERRMTLNFGPLNQEGGERRLNVLISRARDRCVVFSNFRAKDLRTDEGTPYGVRALKVFLQYAENRKLVTRHNYLNHELTSFEKSVQEFLEEKGYRVDDKVGFGSFRVDLAVVNSQVPGHYTLAVECDGPKYYQSQVSRERDRLREQILKSLGWQIYRVWFPDWYRNRAEAEEALLQAVKEAEENIPEEVFSKITIQNKVEEAGEEDLEKGAGSTTQIALLDTVRDYQLCEGLEVKISGDLAEQPLRMLIEVVAEVVEVEGPIHFDELVRRVRDLWGAKRATPKISTNLQKASSLAHEQGRIVERGDFLWPKTLVIAPVRRRRGDISAKIDLICGEEMEEAMKLVLRRQYATMPKDLMKQAARFLGFKVASKAVVERLHGVLDALLEKGDLRQLPNEMIDLDMD